MSGAQGVVAVIDVGKTNAKVVLVDPAGDEIDARQTPNVMRPGPPYPHVDAEALWSFALDALAGMAPRVGAIVPVAHGACAALVDAGGDLVLPILDYEHPAPEAARGGYDPPPLEETGSAPMPGGLNVGLQLHWLEREHPAAFARARHLLFWPQWWAMRLTGAFASEITSLACHTDLWAVHAARPSTLARARGWDRLMPPRRGAGEVLGPLRPDVAARTGLPAGTPVLTGIHDSNASLLPYLGDAPCAVVSTGTWIVSMAIGGTAPRDAEYNVAADGRPVATARAMDGRRREEALRRGEPAEAVDARLGAETARRLDGLGAEGPIHVEGPFARSAAFMEALGAAAGREAIAHPYGAGTTRGAALLARGVLGSR